MAEFTYPVATDEERHVLGLLMYPGMGTQFGIALASVKVEDFSVDKHRRLFRAMVALDAKGEAIDYYSVSRYLADRREMPAVGGLVALTDMADEVADWTVLPPAEGIERWLAVIRDRAVKRQIIDTAVATARKASLGAESSADLISELRNGVCSLESRIRDANEGQGYVDEILERYGGRDYFEPLPESSYLRTGIGLVDDLMPPLRGGEVFVVAARTSAGKSLFATQTGYRMARDGHHVEYLSLEMRSDQLLDRLVSQVGMIPADRIRKRNMSIEQKARAARTVTMIREQTGERLPLNDDRRLNTVPLIAAHLRREMNKRPVRICIIDHLGCVKATGNARSRYEAVSEIIRDLHALAGVLGVVLLILVQLNRATDINNRPPMNADLRDSGVIEEESDFILFIHHMAQALPSEETSEVEMILSKNRLGPKGSCRVQFHRRYLTFGEPFPEPKEKPEEPRLYAVE